MTVTVEIPDDLLARLQKEAESKGLSIDQWLLEIAEERAPNEEHSSGQERSLEEVFAKIRGLADDLDLNRDGVRSCRQGRPAAITEPPFSVHAASMQISVPHE